MREGIYKEIEADYERVRAENRAEETRRIAEATARDPSIGALSEERTALFHRGARAAFARPEDAMAISASLQADMARLSATLRAKLLAAGYAEDYLQPVYQCPLCRDTGYIGEPIRERCSCFTRRVRGRILTDTAHGLDPAETFEAYDERVFADKPLGPDAGDTQRGYMARMRERCEAYADTFPDTERRNLFMAGAAGLGKTYLMNCVGNRVAARGVEVVKLTAYQLTERMRAAIFDRDPDAFSSLLDVPLLLLDDLGVEPMIPNITIEQLFTLLNERALSGRHVVVSTNLTTVELKNRYTERVCSRLFDQRNTLMLSFKGKDVRLGLS